MIHFALGHFPIALLVVGAGVLLVASVLHQPAIQSSALVMLAVGTLLAIPTVVVGLFIAGEHQGDGVVTHRLVGLATLGVATLGWLMHAARARVKNADLGRNVFFAASAVLVGATGYLGGEMVHRGDSKHQPVSVTRDTCSPVPVAQGQSEPQTPPATQVDNHHGGHEHP